MDPLLKAAIRVAKANPGHVQNKLLPLIERYAGSGLPKVTIYFKAPMGIGKVEGRLTEVNDPGGVSYIGKGGSREKMIMTYYSPFILVVEGWNKPDPDSIWDPATRQEGGGVVTQRGRYRSTDPRWESDFLAGPGKSLKQIVLFKDGRKVIDHSSRILPESTGE